MANFFEGLWGLAKHPFDEAEFMVKGARDVVKGDRSVGDLFGDHQDMMSENITVPLGGRNKLTENSDAVAGAIVGGVLAAPLMAGAGGSGASGGSGMFSLGDIGGYFKPGSWGSVSDDALGALADAEAGGAGVANLGKGSDALAATSKGTDWQGIARMLQSIKPANDSAHKISTSGGRSGGGFRFDRNQYENKLLTREYESLYNQPLYNKLT